MKNVLYTVLPMLLLLYPSSIESDFVSPHNRSNQDRVALGIFIYFTEQQGCSGINYYSN